MGLAADPRHGNLAGLQRLDPRGGGIIEAFQHGGHLAAGAPRALGGFFDHEGEGLAIVFHVDLGRYRQAARHRGQRRLGLGGLRRGGGKGDKAQPFLAQRHIGTLHRRHGAQGSTGSEGEDLVFRADPGHGKVAMRGLAGDGGNVILRHGGGQLAAGLQSAGGFLQGESERLAVVMQLQLHQRGKALGQPFQLGAGRSGGARIGGKPG